MVHRLPRLLAILTAWSTVLAGIPLVSAAPATDHLPGGCFSAMPRDADDAADPRAEPGTELEETEDDREEFDSEVDLFADDGGPRRLKCGLVEAVDPDACPAERRFSVPLATIRGPPARG